MPGMPIFQDSPSQLKGQIYVLNNVTQNIVPLQVDNDGNLAVSGTMDLATGAEVGLVTGTEVGLVTGTEVNLTAGTVVGLTTGTEVGLVTGTEVGLVAGTEVTLASDTDINNVDSVTTVGTITNDVKIINGSTALSVELSPGTNLIGKVENQLVFTNVDSFGAAAPLTAKTVSSTATVASDSQDVSQESSYNWFIKNTGTDSSDQDITLKVELSPDEINWLEDTGTVITIPYNTAKMITVTNFLQYVRFVITGGADETTVISCFQAQH